MKKYLIVSTLGKMLHNFQVYNEYQTQSAKVLAMPQEARGHQDDKIVGHSWRDRSDKLILLIWPKPQLSSQIEYFVSRNLTLMKNKAVAYCDLKSTYHLVTLARRDSCCFWAMTDWVDVWEKPGGATCPRGAGLLGRPGARDPKGAEQKEA